MDSFELMALGLAYIEKSGKVLSALPRDYWPTADNLDRCRQTVARARVLLALGEDMCERATPGIVDHVATRAEAEALHSALPMTSGRPGAAVA